MQAYFISLKDRTPHRYRYILRHLRERGFEPVEVPAVNGYSLSDEELNRLVKMPVVKNKEYFSRGTIGCALSHLNAYKMIIESESEAGVIFEDDIYLAPNALEIVHNAMRHATTKSVFLLGYYFEVHLSKHNSISVGNSASLLTPMRFGFASTGAYIIGRNAAQCILNLNQPVSYYADEWESFYKCGCIEDIRLLYPPLLDFVGFQSTITFTSSQFMSKLIRLVELFDLPILNKFMKIRRRKILNEIYRRFYFYDAPSPLAELRSKHLHAE